MKTKKIIAISLIVVMVFCSLVACAENDAESGNELPLDTETFKNVTAEYDSGLSVNEVSVSDTNAQHNIYYAEYPNMEIAGITTGVNNDAKVVNMTFGAGTGSQTTLEAEPYKSKMVTVENVKETLVYAAKLYGFEDENVIYDAFSKGNMEEKDSGTGYKTHAWNGEVDGTDCKVVFNEPDGSGSKVLFSIAITSK